MIAYSLYEKVDEIMADRIWHMEGTIFAILDTYTGRYIADSDDEILTFCTLRAAAEYIERYGLSRKVFKAVEF